MDAVTSRARRPSAFSAAASLLAVLACLVPTADSASSRWGARRTAPSAASALNALQHEKVENGDYSPSIIIPRMVLEVDESKNEQDSYITGQEEETSTSNEQNGMFGRLLATALSIPKSICKNLLNGVVSAIFGGAKPADEDDER